MIRLSDWMAGLVAIGLTIFAAVPAGAATVNAGNLSPGDSFSDTISSPGPTYAQDYSFHLTGSGQLTVLATALSQTSDKFGVDSINLKLFDASMNLITSASGTPIAFFDSFHDTGIALSTGNYLLSVFGDVTAGKKAFLSISIAANDTAPIPASALMMLTALAALGGLVYQRRKWLSGTTTHLPA
ncbi:MAG TPA: hypothetical protein VMT54_11195 [Candidatus Cybelea sp.]|nr:hypothetical protein [Candidatus Cybelea sp.]